MKKIKKQFNTEGTVPIDGEDPQIYSKKHRFHPLSFFRLMPDNSIPAGEEKFLPTVSPPTFMNEEELYAKIFLNKDEVLKGSSLMMCKEYGGLKMTDSDTLSTQRSIFAEIVRKIGMSIFSANRIGFSVPIQILESRSELDRMAELHRIQGFYMSKAAKNSDRLERLKLFSTSMVGCTYLMLRKQKSLNPLWGETMQAYTADGTEINIEQISHHPPSSYQYIIGPNKSYIAYGQSTMEPMFKGTYLLLTVTTKYTVRFRDGHTIELTKRPFVKITGVISGDRMIILKGMLLIEDKTLKLRSVIFYDYGEKKGLISSEKTVPKDWIEGIIYQSTGAPFNDKAKSISELDDIKKEVARIKGSWLDKVKINDVIYWDIDKHLPQPIFYCDNPLPSDSRYREDLVWLRRNNLEMADQWKDALEIRQRRDRDLRAKHMKK